MDVMEAIRTRRTIFIFRPEPVSKETIERFFDAGIWAPNHHLTEPWRFIVLGEKTREILAQRYGEIQESKAADGADDATKQALRGRICQVHVEADHCCCELLKRRR